VKKPGQGLPGYTAQNKTKAIPTNSSLPLVTPVSLGCQGAFGMGFVSIFVLLGVIGIDSKVSEQGASEVGRPPLKRSTKKEVPTLRTRLLPKI